VERIVGPQATGETCHIILETNGDIPFWEGQSYGVLPPVIFPFELLLYTAMAFAISDQRLPNLSFAS